MARRTIVVVGGYGSGVSAAATAREIDEDARIVLVDPAAEASTAVAAVPYAISGEAVSVAALARSRPEALATLYGIEVRPAGGALRVEPGARALHFGGERLEYTALVHAMGAETTPDARVPAAANVQRLRTLADVEAVRAQGGGGGRAPILGGSPSAVDAADAFRRGGFAVTLVHAGPRILADFSEMGSARAADALRAAGIEVLAGETPARSAVEAGRIRSVTLSGGATLHVGLVLVTGPLRPQSALLAAAGAELNEDGSVVVDECCLTSLPARLRLRRVGRGAARGHGLAGVAAPGRPRRPTRPGGGGVAAGGQGRLEPVLNTSIVRAGELTLGRTGLSLEEAVVFAAAEEVGVVSVHGSSCERSLSSSQPLAIDLVYHKGDGRILGAEVAGKAGADKRVDVLSTAIVGGLTVERISTLDLAYAPPFSTTRDVVNVAGGSPPPPAPAWPGPGPRASWRSGRLRGHRGRGAGARPHRRGDPCAGHPAGGPARPHRRPAPGPPDRVRERDRPAGLRGGPDRAAARLPGRRLPDRRPPLVAGGGAPGEAGEPPPLAACRGAARQRRQGARARR